MTNNQKVNISLSFNADTAKAKTQLADLQTSLTKLTTGSNTTSQFGISKEINSAISDVTKLQSALKNATNKTGTLNLGQFKKELTSANLDTKKLADSLAGLGPQGQAAFTKLAQSVATAEVPIKRTNTLLNEFMVSLKNTIKWQISSSVLHGFMGSIQGAYRYAQDLNESLNKIRIVTGQSAEDMAKFAKEANNAAKQLSTTTTAYTDAALIFYQQGLSGKDVTDRTDTVIKMANVTGESAAEVSSYMTAIWNNFDDGSTSLEHFADVITALGATTASSSAEISEGLEKFAAIGKTVGLSYEYATAALATVVASTRQSADIVGTAFKTIFSRLQGLQLGETLEDGVDLNKYSKALDAVGVKVLDTSGNMRDLDSILNDLAGKWDNLSSAQQAALAQTVAGTRQYSQLIALMSNWDKMMTNVTTAKNAEGSLQEQANIYAESWEAARKNVKASMQGIYEQLVDDKFFIGLSNNIAKVVDAIGEMIDGMGGLKTIVPLLGSLFLKTFKNDIAKSIDDAIYNFSLFSTSGQKAMDKFRQSFSEQLASITIDMPSSPALQAQTEAFKQTAIVQNEMLLKAQELKKVGASLTEEEQNRAKFLLEIVESAGKEYIEQNKILQTLEQQNKTNQNKFLTQYGQNLNAKQRNNFNSLLTQQEMFGGLDSFYHQIDNINQNGTVELENLSSIIEQIEQEFNITKNTSKNFYDILEKLGKAKGPEEQAEAIKKLREELDNAGKKADNTARSIERAFDNKIGSKEAKKAINKRRTEAGELGANKVNDIIAFKNLTNAGQSANKVIQDFQGTLQSFGTRVVNTSRGISSMVMAFNSLANLPNIFSDENLTASQKMLQALTAITMALPMVISGFSSLNKSLKIASTTQTLFALTTGKLTAAQELSNLVMKEMELTASGQAVITATIDGVTKKYSQTELKAAINAKKQAKAEEEKAVAMAAANLAMLAGIAAIVAAVAIAVKVYSDYNKKLEDNIKKEEKQLEKTKEKAAKYKEELDAVNKLADSYDELNKKYDIAQLSELRSETYKLCLQYGEQDLAIQALTSSYEKLGDILKEIQTSSAEGLNTENLKALEQSEKLLESKMDKDYANGFIKFFGSIANNSLAKGLYSSIGLDYDDYAKIWYKLVLSPLPNSNLTESSQGLNIYKNKIVGLNVLGKNKNLEQAKNNYNSIFGINTSKIDASGAGIIDRTITGEKRDYFSFSMINEEDFIKAYKTYGEEFLNYVQTSDDEISTNLREILNKDSIKQAINEIEESKKVLKESQKEVFKSKIEKEGIVDIKSFEQEIDKISKDEITKQLFGDDTEAARQYALEVLSEIDSTFEEYASTSLLAEKLTGTAFGADIETVEKQLEKYKEYKSLIADMVNYFKTLGSDIDLEEFFGDIPKELQTLLNEHEYKIEVEAALAKTSNGERLLENEIAELYSKGRIKGIDEKAFATANTATQQFLLMDSVVNNKNFEAYTEEAKKALDDKIKELETKIEPTRTAADVSKKEQAEKVNEKFATTYTGEKDYTDTEIEDLAKKLYNAGNLNTLAKKDVDSFMKIKDLIDNSALTEDILKDFGDSANAAEEAANGYDEASEAIRQLTEDTKIYSKFSKKFYTDLKDGLKEIDNLQKAYKTVYDAQKEYKNQGFYSIDTMQSLLELGPEYLQYLIDENGNLTTNADAIKKATIAELELADARWVEMGAAQLEALASEDMTRENWEEFAAKYSLTNATLASADATIELARQQAFEAAQAAELTYGIDGLTESVEHYYDTIMGVHKNNAESIKKYDKNFAKAMGAASGSKKDKKLYDDEFDRYHDIKEAIEAIEDALSDLDKIQDHVFGQDLIKVLEKENELLEQQKQKYSELMTMQIQHAGELQGNLANYGFNFAADGQITNYAEITQMMLDRVNNNLGNETIEKDYELFKKLLEKYESLLDEIRDTQNTLDDIYYQQIENNLKEFETKIQVELDLKDAYRQVREFFDKIDEDFKKRYKNGDAWSSIFTSAEDRFGTYADGTIQTDLDAFNQVREIIENENYDYTSSDSMFASRTEALEKLKELQEQLKDDAEAMYDLYRETWDTYLDAIDEVKDQWDDIISDFDYINETLDHYAKIIELLYGRRDKKTLGDIYASQINTSISMQSAYRQQIEALRKEREELIAAGAQEGDEDLAKIDEMLRNAESSLLSELEHYLELAQQQLQNAVSLAMDNLEMNLWGDSLENVQQQWNDAKAASEGYYDNVQRIYQMETLESKWKAAINSSKSLKVQQQLAKIMDKQVAALRNKNSLSERDIELAEKELAVYQAQIALEEAQNNKNSMKLTRDEQGNWSYQYVVDEDEVADRQQDLMNATNDWRNTALNSFNDVMEQTQNAWAEYRQRIEQTSSDMTLTDEQRSSRLAEIEEYYRGPDGVITRLLEDFQYIQTNANEATYAELWSLYQMDVNNYQYMTQQEQAAIDAMTQAGINSYEELRDFVIGEDGQSGMYGDILDLCNAVNEEIVNTWNTSAQDMIETMVTNPDSVQNMVLEMYNQIQNAISAYNDALENAEQASGIQWGEISDYIQNTANQVAGVNSQIDQLLAQTNALSGYRQTVQSIANTWHNVSEQIHGALEQYLTLLSAEGETPDLTIPQIPQIPSLNGGGAGSGTGGNGGGPSGVNNNPGKYAGWTFERSNGYYKIYNDKNEFVEAFGGTKDELKKRWPGITSRNIHENHTITPVGFNNNSNNDGNDSYDFSNTSKYELREKTHSNNPNECVYGIGKTLKGYFTEFGTLTGKQAIEYGYQLTHEKASQQKEINNNNNNQKMVPQISSITNTISSRLSGAVNSLSSIAAPAYVPSTVTNNTERGGDNFYITPTFPNVENIKEIQEAILGLPNLAAQYLMRK